MIDTGVELGALLWLLPVLAVGGAIVGLLAGLFGIGGGGIAAPILYELFGVLGVPEAVRIHLAIGSSLAIIVPTALRSFYSHRRRGAVDMEILKIWGPWVVVGVGAGALIASAAPSTTMRIIYAVATFIMGIRMIAARDDWRLGDTVPGQPVPAILGVLIGTIAALLGVGGGVYLATVMLLYGRSIHQAVATSAGLAALVAVPATLGYAWAGWGETGLAPGSLGFVNLPAVAMVIPTSVLVTPLGVRLAHGLSRKALERAFGVFLWAISARFAWSLIG